MTPIYDALVDEFYPESIDLDLPDYLWAFVQASARLRRIPVEMHLQDIVADRAARIVAEASRA